MGFMICLVMYGHHRIFTMQSTVAWPQLLTALIFAASTAMVLIDMDGNLLFGLSTAFVLVCGCAAALLQAGIFGLAGRFPPVYTQAVMSGQGVAGMAVSVLML